MNLKEFEKCILSIESNLCLTKARAELDGIPLLRQSINEVSEMIKNIR